MENNIRRISLYGGSASGKSTLAAYIFSEMKMRGLSVEFTPEYIKAWTYIPIAVRSLDEVYIQAKQIHSEDIILRSGDTKYIVSDSPIYCQVFYAWHYNHSANTCWEPMLQLAHISENLYPSLNIFLERVDSDFNQVGRYETLEQSKDIDNRMKIFMSAVAKQKYVSFNCRDKEGIVKHIINTLENNAR
jgi:thymidylate kinase